MRRGLADWMVTAGDSLWAHFTSQQGSAIKAGASRPLPLSPLCPWGMGLFPHPTSRSTSWDQKPKQHLAPSPAAGGVCGPSWTLTRRHTDKRSPVPRTEEGTQGAPCFPLMHFTSLLTIVLVWGTTSTTNPEALTPISLLWQQRVLISLWHKKSLGLTSGPSEAQILLYHLCADGSWTTK